MQTLPCEAMQMVIDAAQRHGCEAERIQKPWSRKARRSYDRDFLLMGGLARIFVQTKSHNGHHKKDTIGFVTQLNTSHLPLAELSYIVIISGEDIYVLPVEYVGRHATESGSLYFNSQSGGVSSFKSPECFRRLSVEGKSQKVWYAIQKHERMPKIPLAAFQVSPVSVELVCGHPSCRKQLGRQIYRDKSLNITCCSSDCLSQERKTRQ
jgi:hypothetical protein